MKYVESLVLQFWFVFVLTIETNSIFLRRVWRSNSSAEYSIHCERKKKTSFSTFNVRILPFCSFIFHSVTMENFRFVFVRHSLTRRRDTFSIFVTQSFIWLKHCFSFAFLNNEKLNELYSFVRAESRLDYVENSTSKYFYRTNHDTEWSQQEVLLKVKENFSMIFVFSFWLTHRDWDDLEFLQQRTMCDHWLRSIEIDLSLDRSWLMLIHRDNVDEHRSSCVKVPEINDKMIFYGFSRSLTLCSNSTNIKYSAASATRCDAGWYSFSFLKIKPSDDWNTDEQWKRFEKKERSFISFYLSLFTGDS